MLKFLLQKDGSLEIICSCSDESGGDGENNSFSIKTAPTIPEAYHEATTIGDERSTAFVIHTHRYNDYLIIQVNEINL